MNYKLLNLPHIDESIIHDCIYAATNFDLDLYRAKRKEAINNIERPYYAKEWHIGRISEPFDHIQSEKAASFFIVPAPESLKVWIRENITVNTWTTMNLQLMTGGKFIVPHTDYYRKYGVNYIISKTGPETRFYNPKPEFSHLEVVGGPYYPYKNLDLEESIIFETRQWHYLNVSKIHSIENILEPRISISISFVDLPSDWK
jgi:hypothetical protein